VPTGTTAGLRAGPDVDGDFLKGGRLDEDISAEKLGFLGAHESLRRG
jgi:hypothetical protein